MTTQSAVTPTSVSSPRTRRLIILTTIVGVFHHVDHVLRADHSGWPFTPQFNAFTISVLVAYPVVAFIFFTRGRHVLKFALITAVYLATQVGHILLETPLDQYTTWAANASTDVTVLGQPTLLGIAAPPLGVVAVTISFLLSIGLIATMISTFHDARHAMTRE